MAKVEGSGRRSRSEARRFWMMHLSAQPESGLSVAQYCRRHELGAASFYLWRSRLAREAEGAPGVVGGNFREVVMHKHASEAAGEAIEISSVRIRLADERLLGQVLGALMGL